MPDIPTSALVGTLTAISRLKPWATVRRNDRLVGQEYEDLKTFAQDELQVEARALEAANAAMAGRGLAGGMLGAELTKARDESARRWRDTKRASDRRLEEISETEGFTVKVWRKVKRRPWPENADSDELAGMTRAWENEDVRREAVAREIAPLEAAAGHRRLVFP